MPGTAEQRQQAEQELRNKNRKDIFELPPELQIMGNPVRIFNIGPWRYQRSMGSYGQFTIHACVAGMLWELNKKGELVEREIEAGEVAFSKPTEIPYITNDPIHVDMFQMAHRHDSGKKLAQDVLGAGQFHAPSEDLTRWGVFIASGSFPDKKELLAAQTHLNRTYDALIGEADSYWNQGPTEYKNVTEMHRTAAKARGQMDKPWARGVVEMTNCPVCASQINPGAALCISCHTVFDEKRVIEARVPGYESLWANKRERNTPNA